ncbi:hypothetical protein K402DRAFT_459193 [Aulographum hederae CBS 113979]|uniref:Uncharacterized protein n=1 Tax=Aulographum hederae CBS 113979 TaxID=1176131 RepID=A0A6G1HG14_9PEZI|nr:hypothetical protein K402DRAFT_459193 [Aulographum hederae CBS 113979]
MAPPNLQRQASELSGALNGLIEDQNRELESLRRQNESFKAKAHNAPSQKLKSQNTSLLAENQSLKDQAKKLLSKQQQEWNTQIYSLRAENRTLKAENQSFEADYQAFEEEHQSFEIEYQSLKVENQSLREEHQSLRAENQSLRAENQSLRAENLAFQTQDQASRTEEQAPDQQVRALPARTQASNGLSGIEFNPDTSNSTPYMSSEHSPGLPNSPIASDQTNGETSSSIVNQRYDCWRQSLEEMVSNIVELNKSFNTPYSAIRTWSQAFSAFLFSADRSLNSYSAALEMIKPAVGLMFPANEQSMVDKHAAKKSFEKLGQVLVPEFRNKLVAQKQVLKDYNLAHDVRKTEGFEGLVKCVQDVIEIERKWVESTAKHMTEFGPEQQVGDIDAEILQLEKAIYRQLFQKIFG